MFYEKYKDLFMGEQAQQGSTSIAQPKNSVFSRNADNYLSQGSGHSFKPPNIKQLNSNLPEISTHIKPGQYSKPQYPNPVSSKPVTSYQFNRPSGGGESDKFQSVPIIHRGQHEKVKNRQQAEMTSNQLKDAFSWEEPQNYQPTMFKQKPAPVSTVDKDKVFGFFERKDPSELLVILH